jgi:hypothetical protein
MRAWLSILAVLLIKGLGLGYYYRDIIGFVILNAKTTPQAANFSKNRPEALRDRPVPTFRPSAASAHP